MLRSTLHWAETAVVLALAIAGLAWARQRIVPHMRARNKVEKAVMIAMIVAVDHRDLHHRRHRRLADLREPAVLRPLSR